MCVALFGLCWWHCPSAAAGGARPRWSFRFGTPRWKQFPVVALSQRLVSCLYFFLRAFFVCLSFSNLPSLSLFLIRFFSFISRFAYYFLTFYSEDKRDCTYNRLHTSGFPYRLFSSPVAQWTHIRRMAPNLNMKLKLKKTVLNRKRRRRRLPTPRKGCLS